MSDLLCVPVEQLGRPPTGEQSAANNAFARLTPSRVINIWIYVGVKPVFVGRKLVPRGSRLVCYELNLDQRLGALEPVFPRNNQPNRGAILITQRLAVKTRRHERKFVSRFR